MDFRLTQVEGGPGDGGASYVHEKVLPALKDLDGYAGLVLVVDRESGRGQSFSLWSDEATMQASADTAGGLRDGASSQGYDVSFLGNYHVEAFEPRGGEPTVARVLKWTGSGDVQAFVRDPVLPGFEAVEGFCGLLAGASSDGGVGMSLWADAGAREAAGEAMSSNQDAMAERGFEFQSSEFFDVEVLEMSQTATT